MSRPIRLLGPLLAALLTVIFAMTLAACETAPRRAADGTMVGRMTAQHLSQVTIDGKPHRLAPGARIVGPNNTTITPNQVPADAQVRYRLDASGHVSHVWVIPAGR